MTRVVSSPIPARTFLLVCTSALCSVVALVTLSGGSLPLAGCSVLLAMLPLCRSCVHRAVAEVIAWLVLAFSLSFSVLRGDSSLASIVVTVVSCLRIVALRRESARRWACAKPVTASDSPLQTSITEVLTAALRAAPEDSAQRIDAAVVALAHTDASAVPADLVERRVFWIHVYNILASHASRARTSRMVDEVLERFRTQYRVCGAWLTPNEIEHGLLRNNAPPPGWPWRLFRQGDPRTAWCVPLDARIHFALHCASQSCPPIRVYRSDRLDAQLRLAESAFLEAETVVDVQNGVTTTSRILSWYATDFGGIDGVRECLARVLSRPEVRQHRLLYRAYDWTVPERLIPPIES